MKRIVSALWVLLLIGCQATTNEKVDLKTLKDEVFDIHDAVMPKMGDLRRVRKDLVLKADSIQEFNQEKAQSLTKASDQIAAANESMMDWMRNFNPDFEGTYQEVLDYLNEQKAGITKVRDDMEAALKEGKEIIEKDL
ncbi:MAG: hypothetical protein AAGA66_01095 [Bacteroidota bacterium]